MSEENGGASGASPADEPSARADRVNPRWIFDIERERMHWANAPALALWSADTLDELLARDFAADMSSATRARLAASLASLRAGRSWTEVWTLFPLGQPATRLCRCAPAELGDGRVGMAVEVIDDDPVVDESTLRAVEAMRQAPSLVTIHDPDGTILLRNAAALEQLSAQGRFGDHLADEAVAGNLWQTVQRDGRATVGAQVRTARGARYHVIEARATRDPVIGQALVVTYESDDTERHRLAESLATANELLEALVNELPTAILVEDADRHLRTTNRAFCRMFGLDGPPAALVGADCKAMLTQAKHAFADPEHFAARTEAILAAREAVSGEELRMSDGRILARSYQPVFVGGHYQGHFWQYDDVTASRRMEEGLRREARYDWLTGLPNRRSTEAALSAWHTSSAAGGGQAALMIVDVDHFKAVNDGFGHDAGDRVLAEVAQALRASVRPMDIVGRFGGEEFVVLLPDTDVSEGRAIAERVRAAPAERACLRPDGTPITVSVGLTVFGSADANPTAAVARADRALYAAKKAGRDRVAERLQ